MQRGYVKKGAAMNVSNSVPAHRPHRMPTPNRHVNGQGHYRTPQRPPH